MKGINTNRFITHPFSFACLIFMNSPEEFKNEYILFSLIFTLFYSKRKNRFYPMIQFTFILISTILFFNDYRSTSTLDASTNYLGLLFGLKCFDQKKYAYQGFLLIGMALNGSFCLYDQNLNSTLLVFGSFLYFIYLLFKQQNISFNLRFNLKLFKNIKFYFYSLFTIFITSIFFFVFPRISVNFSPNSNFVSQSGFSGSAKPGQVSELQLSNNSIFTVQFDKNPPPIPKMYWIGAVLEESDGYHWKETKNKAIFGLSRKNQEVAPQEISRYQIQIQSQTSRHLFILDNPTKQPDANFLFYPSSNKSFARYQSTSEKVRYRGYSAPEALSIGKDQKLYEKQRYIKAPENVKRLARRLKGNTIAKTINNIQNWFIKENFVYTLSPGRTDSLDNFLFDSKKGFCTHYASAVSILLRYAGINSRLITGFHGGDYNEVGDFYSIKGKDAHAWLEYLDERMIWNRVDPVQWIRPDRIRLGGQRFFALSPNGENQIDPNSENPDSLFISIQKYFDLVNLKWQSLLYNYDREGQKSLAKTLGLRLREFFLTGFGIVLTFFFLLIIMIRLRKRPRSIKDHLEKLERAFNQKGMKRSPQESFNSFLNKVREGQSSQFKEKVSILGEIYQNYYFKPIKTKDEVLITSIYDVIKALKQKTKK